MKTAPRGRKFADIRDIRKNINLTINSVPLDSFNDCFVEVVERHYKCVTFEGVRVPLISCILSVIVDRVPELYCSVSYNLNLKAHIVCMFPKSRGACCVVRTFRASIKIGNVFLGGRGVLIFIPSQSVE